MRKDNEFLAFCFAVSAFLLVLLPVIVAYSYNVNVKAEHCRADGLVAVQYNGSVYCASIESLKVPK